MENALRGKVILVTGATSGIGLETARQLADMGAAVIGVGRNLEKSAAAAEQVRQESGNPQVEYLNADLSSQEQIRRLVEGFCSRYERLDVLVNNAGGFFNKYAETADGIELTFALNHLNYFLLTSLLLDLLVKSTPARVVNVSSDAHRNGRINFDDLEGKQHYNGWRAYAQSKLANVLFTYELARRLEGTGVTANALHPGFVATGFGHNNRDLVGWGTRLAQRLAARTPEQGAQTSIYLAASPAVEGVTGKYFVDEKPVPSSPLSYDQSVARQLWEVSAAMTGLDNIPPVLGSQS
jgi:NAD(P)-dependent dehydrogenase (short-subunit alcohol dehydrogenase family)